MGGVKLRRTACLATSACTCRVACHTPDSAHAPIDQARLPDREFRGLRSMISAVGQACDSQLAHAVVQNG